MLSEMVKFSSQHRALYCYLIMSVWIFLIVAGMYKYIGMEESVSMPKQSFLRRDVPNHMLRGDVKLKKIISKYCNAPEHIKLGTEGLPNNESWALQGVILIIRHGDRGPLTHVRGIEKVKCNPPNPSPLLQRYQEYISTATGAGRAPWAQAPGPFHNFPLLPGAPATACRLGQLSLLGVQQLLATGALLSQAYAEKLGWTVHNGNISTGVENTSVNKTTLENQIKGINKEIPSNGGNMKASIKPDALNIKEAVKATSAKVGNVDSKPIILSGRPMEGEVVVHSTRYRRALQSGLALVWSLLGPRGAAAASARESPSLAFCAADCACPAADRLAKLVSQELRERLDSHPAIGELVSQLSKVVSQSPSQAARDPHILEDALLAYTCHGAHLPCMEKPTEIVKTNSKISKQDKKKLDALKTADGKLRALLQLSKRILNKDVVKRKEPQIHRRLLNILNSKELIKPDDGVLVRKIRDVRARRFDSRPKVAPLDFDSQMEKEKLGYYQQKFMENADMNYQDVILVKRNMDGDFNFNGESPNNANENQDDDSDDYEDKEDAENEHGKASPGSIETICVRKDQVTGLFAYTDWEMKQNAKSKNLKKASLLRAYGMIRHIVQYILKIISEGKPKLVLFSGHDKTLQYLSLALGLVDDNLLHIHYASRMAIEIYRNSERDYLKGSIPKDDGRKPRVAPPLDFYLRIVMNGQDITNQLSFCRGRRSIIVVNRENSSSSKSKNKKSYLCRIENIIRFTHEDYFSIFNATNFKDACAMH